MARPAMRTAVWVLCAAGTLRGDAVLLRNGERIEGRILGGTANQVHVSRPDGTGRTWVQAIDRAEIDRIERDTPATQPAGRVPASQPTGSNGPSAELTGDAAEQASAAELTAETQRTLIVAIAKWRAEDFAGAGIDLSRLINSASADEREAMSAMTQATTRKTLAELAADTHFQAAVAGRRGSAMRFSYVTEYEKQALIPMLVAAYERTLKARERALLIKPSTAGKSDEAGRRAAPPSRRPVSSGQAGGSARQPWYAAYAQTQPASGPAPIQPGDPPAVIDWLDRPGAFDGTAEEAKTLLSRVHQAVSLLNERVRLDPALRRNAALKRSLLADKQRLVAMGKVLADYSVEPEPKPAAETRTTAADQSRREEFEKRIEEARQAEAKRVQEAREAARKWQEEQERQNKGFSWFDWLKPAEKNQPAQPPVTAPPTESAE